MPIFITNFVLPLALSFIRSYLYNPSHKHDGEILDTVKESVAYLARCDNNSMSYGHVASVGSVKQYSDMNGGL